MDQIESLSDEKLMMSAHDVVTSERDSLIVVLRYFREIYQRRLHLKYGRGSLLELLMVDFGYYNGSAQRRVGAIRLMIDIPNVEEKIEDGRLTITAASQIQSFLRVESKYTPAQKLELVEFCERKSTRAIEKELVIRNPLAINGERLKAVDANRTQITVVVSDQLLEKLDRLKSWLSHQEAGSSYEKLFEYLTNMGLNKLDPNRKVQRVVKSFPAREKIRSRAIPLVVRREVWRKNAGRGCEFENEGVSCGSKYQLQVDHRILFSQGGCHEVENLRLFCAQHNRWVYSEFERMNPTASCTHKTSSNKTTSHRPASKF